VLASIGSSLGVLAAGKAAVGSWKKCFLQNKNAPFMLVAFIGAPLSQTVYGMILMNAIKAAEVPPMVKFGVGVLGGFAIGLSAWFQGQIGAVASDALAETGKGFGNYIMAIGIIETVAIFVLIFLMTAL
jgi:V/A-type H+-transporting ATPase subunit K